VCRGFANYRQLHVGLELLQHFWVFDERVTVFDAGFVVGFVVFFGVGSEKKNAKWKA
jgi:hypothetical protein